MNKTQLKLRSHIVKPLAKPLNVIYFIETNALNKTNEHFQRQCADSAENGWICAMLLQLACARGAWNSEQRMATLGERCSRYSLRIRMQIVPIAFAVSRNGYHSNEWYWHWHSPTSTQDLSFSNHLNWYRCLCQRNRRKETWKQQKRDSPLFSASEQCTGAPSITASSFNVNIND